MNKYQKALGNIGYIELDDSFDHPKTIKDWYHNEYRVLQELVDKATPKKPIIVEERGEEPWSDKTTSIYICPNCGEPLSYDFEYDIQIKNSCCLDCRQALDWSDEDGVKSTDVMFEELGLLKQMQTPFKGWVVYGNEFNGRVTFDTNCNSVGTNMTITPELHKAIGAKMKELGWL